MSDLYNISAAASMANARPIFQLVAALEKKQNKSREENEALESFRKTKRFSLIILLVMFVIFSILMVNFFISTSSTNLYESREGTVEGNRIRYVQNDIKYVDISELDVDKNKLSDGDKVELEFDSSDKLTGKVVTDEDFENEKHNAISLFISLVILLVISVTAIVISRGTMGKPFKNFVLQSTCVKCGKLNISEVGAEKWDCIRCGAHNNRNADYSEYVKKEKRNSFIFYTVIIIIALLISPIYLKLTDTSFVPDSMPKKISMPDIVKEKSKIEEVNTETEDVVKESSDDALDKVSDDVDKIHEMLNNL